MNEDIQILFSRLFVIRRLVCLIAGAFGVEFASGQATYLGSGQTVV
jgi:hypothetical protein